MDFDGSKCFEQAAASPAMESLLDRPWKRGSGGRVVPILGVPSGAVVSFTGYLYSSKCVNM